MKGEHQGNQRAGFLLKEKQDGARRLGGTGTVVWAVCPPPSSQTYYMFKLTTFLTCRNDHISHIFFFCVNLQVGCEHEEKN